MASHPSMMPEQDLRMRSHDELVGIVRRLESDKLSLISEHSAVMHEVNRRLHTHLVEIRALRDANLKAETEMHLLRTESAQRARASAESRLTAERSAVEIQRLKECAERSADEIRRLRESVEQSTAETRELRELCCFLDDDRQRLRRLADQWQQHGQHLTSVTLDDQGCVKFAALASELEQKQNAIVEENTQLRELCLFLDDERNAALAGGSAASRQPAAAEAPTAAAIAASTASTLDNASLSRVKPATVAADRRRGLGDGASSLPTSSIHPAAVTASKGDLVANGGDTAASYIKALEAQVRSLELERNKYRKILEVSEIMAKPQNAAASVGPEASAVPLDVHVRSTSSVLSNGLPFQTSPNVPLDTQGIGKDVQQSEKAIVQELCNVLWRKLGNGTASFPSVSARIDPQGGSLPGFDRQGPQGSSSSSIPAAEDFGGGTNDARLEVPFAASVALTDRNVKVSAGDVSGKIQAVAAADKLARQLPSQPSHAFISTGGERQLSSNESAACYSSSVLSTSNSVQLPAPAAVAPSRTNDAHSAAGGALSHNNSSHPGPSSEPASRSSTDRYTSFVVTGKALLPNGGDRLQVHRFVDSAGRSTNGADASKYSGGGGTQASGSGAVVDLVTLANVSSLPTGLTPSHHLLEGRPAPAIGGGIPSGRGEYAASCRMPSFGDRSNAAFVGLGDHGATGRGLGDPGVTIHDVALAGRPDVVQTQQQRSDTSSRSGSVSSTSSWPAVVASANVSSTGAGGSRGLLGGSDHGVSLQPSAAVACQQRVAAVTAAASVGAGSAVSPSGSSSSSTERLSSQRSVTRVPFTRPFVQQPPRPEQQQPSVQQLPHVGGSSRAPPLRVRSHHGDAHQLL